MTERVGTQAAIEIQALREELSATRQRLQEAEQALEAIRTGEVESLVVDGPNGVRIFSLEGATQYYRALIEEMNEGAATVGEDGTIVYCNACFAGMLGEPLERVMGSSIRDHVPDRYRFDLECLLRRGLEADVRQELALVGPSNEEVSALLAVSHIVEEGRNLLCLVATDLREQKRAEALVRAEQAARESETRYRAIFENTDDPQSVLQAVRDDDGRICDWVFRDVNEAGLRVLGQRRDDVVGRSVKQLVREGPSALESEWARVLASGETWTYEQDFQGAHYLCRVFRMGESTIVHAATDITELKRVEDALREGEGALREADRRKSEFLAMLSHELRNPLSPIKNSLYILDRAAPGGDQAKRAQSVIDRQVNQLVRLVDDLLDVTRITRNKMQLKLERLDLNEVVRRTVEDHRSLFERHGVRLEATFEPEPVIVAADWARLAQVVANLLSNAAKFTGWGGATRVSVDREAEMNRAILRVADTGVGMTSEILARIFEPFTQADRTLDRSKGGLGLGLALVKGLVSLHGGEVSAHSVGVGKGSEFVVSLPLGVVASSTVSGSPPRRGRARRMLIIEDNADGADSLREALQLDGHDVAVAYDGPEGIKQARELRPDIIFCDIGLPGMDGYEVARVLRSEGAPGGTYLVALTGYALPEDLERAAKAGFDRHLAKPPSLEKINELLEGLQSPAAGAAHTRGGLAP